MKKNLYNNTRRFDFTVFLKCDHTQEKWWQMVVILLYYSQYNEPSLLGVGGIRWHQHIPHPMHN